MIFIKSLKHLKFFFFHCWIAYRYWPNICIVITKTDSSFKILYCRFVYCYYKFFSDHWGRSGEFLPVLRLRECQNLDSSDLCILFSFSSFFWIVYSSNSFFIFNLAVSVCTWSFNSFIMIFCSSGNILNTVIDTFN